VFSADVTFLCPALWTRSTILALFATTIGICSWERRASCCIILYGKCKTLFVCSMFVFITYIVLNTDIWGVYVFTVSEFGQCQEVSTHATRLAPWTGPLSPGICITSSFTFSNFPTATTYIWKHLALRILYICTIIFNYMNCFQRNKSQLQYDSTVYTELFFLFESQYTICYIGI